MAKVEQELAKEVADWIETSGMNKITKNLFKKNPAMAERAYKAAQEEAGTMPAKVASKSDLIAPEDMPSPPPLASRAKAEPAMPASREGTPEATAEILGGKKAADDMTAIEPEVMPDEFEVPRPQRALPEGGNINRGVQRMGDEGIVEEGLTGAQAAYERRRQMNMKALPPPRTAATGEVIQMGEGGLKEKGLEKAKYPGYPGRGVDQTLADETLPPSGAVADAAAVLSSKEEAQARAYAKTAGISEDAAKRKLFGKKLAIGAGLAGAAGTAAYLATRDKEAPAVMETPSPLSEKGKAAYEATVKGQAAKPDYSAASLMQPPTLSASKVGRNAPEAPDMSEEDAALAEQLARMQNEMKIIAAEYKATKDQQAKQQLWEGLISGLGAIASGMYGLKHGIDMSGVKFDRTNWDAKAAAAREDWIAGRMAAEKDYELSKSIIDQKRKGKLDNWEINQKLYENAAREAQRRDDMSYKSAGLGLEAQKLGAQMENWKEEAANRKAELMLKIKQGSGDKTMQNLILGKIDDFDKTLATYGKNEDDLSLQTLKRLNGEINKLTGAPLVPESSFEGGWFSGPEAADIEKARTPDIAADANTPLPSGGKVRMMDKQGRKMEVPEENVEKAKAAGWQILQN